MFCIPTWTEAAAETVADQFYNCIVCEHCRGIPKQLISDRDKFFTSRFWQAFQRAAGTSVRMSTARQQSTNGGAERMVATITEILSMELNFKQDNWVKLLPQLTYAINDSPTPLLQGRTPLYVEMGFNPLKPIDLHPALDRGQDARAESIGERIDRMRTLREEIYEAIVSSRLRMKTQADKHRRTSSTLLKKGMKAWLDIEGIQFTDLHLRPAPKLNPRYYGPFDVVSQPGANRFELKLPDDCRAHPVFHVSRLKPWTDPDVPKKAKQRLPRGFGESAEYEVDRIIDHDFKHGIQFYRVKWKNYAEVGREATWQPREDLEKNASKILEAYERKHNISADKPIRRKPKQRMKK